MTQNYKIYGAGVSYFTGKARAYLDWAQIPYEEIPAGRDVYRDVILPRVGWPVIPVVVGPDDETLQDTSDIIEALDTRMAPPSIHPGGPRQRVVSLLMELYGDEWLVLPAMHYRWNYNRDFAYSAFGALSAPDATAEEQFAIGEKLAVNFEGALPVLGVTDDTIAAIEASYLALLDELNAHFSAHDTVLGTRPSLADFGLYGPLYAHLYRDPASGEIMKTRAPQVAKWVERLRDGQAAHPGAFLADDTIADTLLPVLARQLSEQFPVLRATAAALTTWATDKTPGQGVPRALGPHPFQLGEATGTRMIFPFNLWMLQRVLDAYNGCDPQQRKSIDAVLGASGDRDALSGFPPFPRLDRANYKLVLGA